jgi:hypothetical protein
VENTILQDVLQQSVLSFYWMSVVLLAIIDLPFAVAAIDMEGEITSLTAKKPVEHALDYLALLQQQLEFDHMHRVSKTNRHIHLSGTHGTSSSCLSTFCCSRPHL